MPDTFGFNGIDTSQCTGDTVALTYPSGISGLGSAVKLRCNGNGVERIGNTALSEPTAQRAANAHQQHETPRAVCPPAIRSKRSTGELSVRALPAGALAGQSVPDTVGALMLEPVIVIDESNTGGTEGAEEGQPPVGGRAHAACGTAPKVGRHVAPSDRWSGGFS